MNVDFPKYADASTCIVIASNTITNDMFEKKNSEHRGKVTYSK